MIPLLAFTISGPMAHFRKFYTTTSSLTYPFPPRTTIAGLVAGLLGLSRDSYYQELSSERLWVSVRTLTPVRTKVFTVNYLFTKDKKLYEDGKGTQIPVEWVFPKPPLRVIKYRVYLHSPDGELWKKLKDNFEKRTFQWPPYLGVTEALSWIEDVWIGEVPFEVPKEAVLVATPLVYAEGLQIRLNGSQGVRLISDRMTLDLETSPYRSPEKTVTVVYEAEGRPFKVVSPYPLFKLPDDPSLYGGFFRVFITSRSSP